MKRKRTLIIAVAAVLVLGIGFGAGMAVKSSQAAQGSQISVEEAKAIALSNVGVSEEKATFTKAKLDNEGHYDIEFFTESLEYDFEVDAKSGSILSKDAEARDHVKADADKQKDQVQQSQSQQQSQASGQQSQKQQSQQPAAKPSSGSNDSAVIGVESAKSIAVRHAGVSGASFTKAYLDHDDGLRVYELEFRAGGFEYDYEINAYNGAILDWDKDRIEPDDDWD